MSLVRLIACLSFCFPLAANAFPTTWNIDDPTGTFVGSFVYEGVGGYSNVAINATDGLLTADWNSVGGPTSDVLFTSGPGSFNSILELMFGSSLQLDAPPVATDWTIFSSQGNVFSTGSFDIITDIPPEYERPQAPVPAPGTIALMLLGLLSVVLHRGRRRAITSRV